MEDGVSSLGPFIEITFTLPGNYSRTLPEGQWSRQHPHPTPEDTKKEYTHTDRHLVPHPSEEGGVGTQKTGDKFRILCQRETPFILLLLFKY